MLEVVEFNADVCGCVCKFTFSKPKDSVIDRGAVYLVLETAVTRFLSETGLRPDQVTINPKLRTEHPFYEVIDLGVTVLAVE